MVMEKHKRWYDNDPTVSLMVSMLEKVDEKIQLECAKLIIKKAKNYGIRISDDDLEETVKNFFRRWYDKNRILQEAFEYLRRAPFDFQGGIAFSVIEKLQELDSTSTTTRLEINSDFA